MSAHHFIPGSYPRKLPTPALRYISEVSPASRRGLFLALCTDFSIVFAQAVAGGVSFTAHEMCAAWPAAVVCGSSGTAWWRVLMGLGLPPALTMVLALPFLPESPRWLVQQGRQAEALQVLQKLCGGQGDEAGAALEAIVSAIGREQAAPAVTGCSKVSALWSTVPRRRACTLGLMLMLAQQATGVSAVVYYAPVLLEASGFFSERTTLIVGAVGSPGLQLIGCTCCVFLVDKIGRRHTMLFSSTIVVATLFALSIAYAFSGGVLLAAVQACLLLIYCLAFGAGCVNDVGSSNPAPVTMQLPLLCPCEGAALLLLLLPQQPHSSTRRLVCQALDCSVDPKCRDLPAQYACGGARASLDT